MKTKVDIISGFLGAGKTTLIKKLLEENSMNEKLVIIENEFGEIGIDGILLKKSGIEIREINSGCICCSLAGDFESSILEVVQKLKPERIMIEPSGVGKLSEVIKACESSRLKELIQINMVVTVVDSLKYEMYLSNFGEFFENQIKHARTVVLSRTQKVPGEKLESLAASIRKLNGKANIVTTPWESLKSGQIIAVAEQDADTVFKQELEEVKKVVLKRHEPGKGCKCGSSRKHERPSSNHGCSCGEHGHSHDADEIFEVWAVETPKRFDKAHLEKIVRELNKNEKCGVVLRGKGILQTKEDEWIQFDFVPGEAKVKRAEAEYTGKICIIGSRLNKRELGNLFEV